jgi:lysophospholipase L1-like esterase
VSRILIIGDSLTAGVPGISYTLILRRTFPDDHFLINGLGGDTLAGAAQRARALLAKTMPDVLVLEIGVNDLLIPHLAAQGGLWRAAIRLVEPWRGAPTPDGHDFRDLYARTVDEVRQGGVARIIVTTLTCLGENLSSPPNRQREALNAVIRGLVARENLLLADAGHAFDLVLQHLRDPSAYLLPHYACLLADVVTTRVETAADTLSRRRQLLLTTDGVHLNRRGAQLMAEAIAEQIRRL